MIARLASLCLVFFLAFLPAVAFAENYYVYSVSSQADAETACASYLKSALAASSYNEVISGCAYMVDSHTGKNSYGFVYGNHYDTNPDDEEHVYVDFSGTYTAPPSCKAGFTPPVGATLSKYSDGTRCYQGCEMDLNLVSGSSNFGQQEEDGSTCPVESGSPTDESNSWTPGDTTLADGSRRSCDSLGNCVIYKPAADSPAPASSASGDHSTASNSNTTNPASSSSSTTTYNYGDSSGSGSGSGDGTGVVSSNTKTDSPASTSSTSTKCTTGVCDVGDADGVVGSLYTPGTDTPSSVFNEFKSEVSSAPITQAVSGFFSLTASSSCPTWTIPGNKYWGEAGFTFDFFCQSAILALLQFAGYIVLAVAAYAAFKIAIY